MASISHLTDRRPKPKEMVRGSCSGCLPSCTMKRSGRNSAGPVYERGSLSMALLQGIKQCDVQFSEDVIPNIRYD